MRKKIEIPCLVAAAVLVLAPAAFAQGGFNGPGRYEIANVKSGKVLDLDTNDQTSVIQFSSRGTNNQIWEVRRADAGYYYLINTMNGNALEVTGTGNSTPVRGGRFNNSPSQQWRFDTGKDGNIIIVSRQNKALDIPDGTDRDGTRVQIYDPNGDSNQRFTFRSMGGAVGSRRQGNFGGYGNTVGSGAIITCSSDDGRRNYCNADTRGGVQLTRQISGSQCREGDTWGYDGRGIWVDRGCRAEFQTGRGGAVYGGNSGPVPNVPSNANAQVMQCSSDHGRRTYCEADTRGGVRLMRQISGSACQEGETWGFDRRGIWVDRGCRGEFEVGLSNRQQRRYQR